MVTGRRRRRPPGILHALPVALLLMAKSNTSFDFESTVILGRVDSEATAEPVRAEVRPGIFDGVACRGARAMLGITQTELCALAQCGRNTLNDFEMQTRQPRKANVGKLRGALEALGAEFLDCGEGSVVVRVPTRYPGVGDGSGPRGDA